MVEIRKPIITVTGITGYIGSQVGFEVLKSKNYKLRGTTRDLNSDKIDALRKLFGSDFDEVELKEADLLNPESIMNAIAGSTFVIHVASPYIISEPKDPQTIITPAVEGTLSVLRACRAAGVRRVSITSALVTTDIRNQRDAPDVLTQDHWSDNTVNNTYEKSKTLAERAAWDFVKALPPGEKIELTTVLPGLVVGPTEVFTDFSSGEVIKMFMLNTFPTSTIPKIQMAPVDVRDVALAHVRCIQIDEAQGKRFILSAKPLWFLEIG